MTMMAVRASGRVTGGVGNIRVRIDRLTLEGVDWRPVQRAQFERAFAGELSRLLREPAPQLAERHEAFLKARFTQTGGGDPRAMGMVVARSIFERLRAG
jgi:hypothetical protein